MSELVVVSDSFHCLYGNTIIILFVYLFDYDYIFLNTSSL